MRAMEFKAEIISGVEVGAKFGIATANLCFLEKKPDLKEGVYFVQIKVKDEVFNGILHFGVLKTFGRGFAAEVHILDFDQDIYGEVAEISILKYIRSTRTFLNADLLFTQIENDREKAEKFFCRRAIFQKWEMLKKKEKDSFSIQAIDKISVHKKFLETTDILIYAPQGDREIDFTKALMKRFSEKRYFFPKIVDAQMQFFQIQSFEELKVGSFRILEPEGLTRIFELKQKTLIFLPAVAADKKCFRLGRGSGFYDRFLNQCNIEKEQLKRRNLLKVDVYSLCVLPNFAILHTIPVQMHDQMVNEVLAVD